MLSHNLGDLLATMEKVKNIDGVAERDAAVVEARQTREDRFLGHVLSLAQVPLEEGNPGRTGTKYSDSEIQLDFDDQDYAQTIMDLAKASGVAAGEVVPSRLKDGGVRLSVMPHVFASDQMEDVRGVLGLGVEESVVEGYSAFVSDIVERANPRHKSSNGKFTSQADLKSNGGSRSFQFSRPRDAARKTRSKNTPPPITFNKPDFHKNRQFRIRSVPCGRAARPYFRKMRGMSEIPQNQWYVRCHDGKVPDWARRRKGKAANESITMIDSKRAAKEVLASVLRENKAR